MKNKSIMFRFFKVNLLKTKSAILTLMTFLVVMNMLLGILFSVTGMFSKSITKNETMNYVEIILDGSIMPEQAVSDVRSVPHVKGAFIDTAHMIVIPCDNEAGGKGYNLLGVPRELLSSFGVENEEEKFLYIPREDKEFYKSMSEVLFEETIYVDVDGYRVPRLVEFSYENFDFYEKIDWDLFPSDIVLCDEKTALEIAYGATESGDIIYSDRIICYVEDVSYLKDVENDISRMLSGVDVRYDLKHTGKLPEYASILVGISGMIIALILTICVFNIKSNIDQLINLRKRDLGLLSLFGVDNGQIRSMFVKEFVLYGVLSFIGGISLSVALMYAMKMAFGLDVLTPYIWIYLFVNLSVAIVVFAMVSDTVIRKHIASVDKSKIYKELLK